jgi:hypothetical protein
MLAGQTDVAGFAPPENTTFGGGMSDAGAGSTWYEKLTGIALDKWSRSVNAPAPAPAPVKAASGPTSLTSFSTPSTPMLVAGAVVLLAIVYFIAGRK